MAERGIRLSDIGKGAGALEEAIGLTIKGVLYATGVAAVIMTLVWGAVFLTLTSAAERSIWWSYNFASVTGWASKSATVSVNGRKFNSRQFAATIDAGSPLTAEKNSATLKSVIGQVIGFIPAAAAWFGVLFVSFVAGQMLRTDEILEGATVLDDVEEFNALVERQMRGVELVERPYIKVLRGIS